MSCTTSFAADTTVESEDRIEDFARHAHRHQQSHGADRTLLRPIPNTPRHITGRKILSTDPGSAEQKMGTLVTRVCGLEQPAHETLACECVFPLFGTLRRKTWGDDCIRRFLSREPFRWLRSSSMGWTCRYRVPFGRHGHHVSNKACFLALRKSCTFRVSPAVVGSGLRLRLPVGMR